MNQHPLAEVSTAQGIIGSAYREVNASDTGARSRRAAGGGSVLCCKRQTL
jgi:hypothetical protein